MTLRTANIRKEQKLILTMQCEEAGVKKRKTLSYMYFKTCRQHQRKARHVLPRGVCLRCRSSLWCLELPFAWRDTLPSIPRSSHAFLFTLQTPFCGTSPVGKLARDSSARHCAIEACFARSQQSIKYCCACSLAAAFLFQETVWCSLQNFPTSFNTTHKVWSSLVVGFMSFTDDGMALCHTQHFQAFH